MSNTVCTLFLGHVFSQLCRIISFYKKSIKIFLAIEQIKGDDAIFSRKPPRLNARIPEIETIWNIAPSYKTSDPIPVRNAKNVLIATTWRTGSSFLGDILNHYPGTYYSYEPLHYLRNLVMKLQVFFEYPFHFFFSDCRVEDQKIPGQNFYLWMLSN